LSRHNKSSAHLKRTASGNKDPQSNPNTFVDCGEDIKENIKFDETLDVDPLSIQMKVEHILKEEAHIEIKQEIEEERIHDQDPLSIMARKIEIDDV
jgi:hypothetical protein